MGTAWVRTALSQQRLVGEALLPPLHDEVRQVPGVAKLQHDGRLAGTFPLHDERHVAMAAHITQGLGGINKKKHEGNKAAAQLPRLTLQMNTLTFQRLKVGKDLEELIAANSPSIR